MEFEFNGGSFGLGLVIGFWIMGAMFFLITLYDKQTNKTLLNDNNDVKNGCEHDWYLKIDYVYHKLTKLCLNCNQLIIMKITHDEVHKMMVTPDCKDITYTGIPPKYHIITNMEGKEKRFNEIMESYKELN